MTLPNRSEKTPETTAEPTPAPVTNSTPEPKLDDDDDDEPTTSTATFINLRTGRTYTATFEGDSTPYVIQFPDPELETVDGTDKGELDEYVYALMVREDRLGESYPTEGYESFGVITPQTYPETLAVYARLAHGKAGAQARKLQLMARSRKSEYPPVAVAADTATATATAANK